MCILEKGLSPSPRRDLVASRLCIGSTADHSSSPHWGLRREQTACHGPSAIPIGYPQGAQRGGVAPWSEAPSRASGLGALYLRSGDQGCEPGRRRGVLRALCQAPSRGEPALRASTPPASGGLSPRRLQLLQLLLLAAAGNAGRAPKSLRR